MSEQQDRQRPGPDPSFGRRALSTRGYVVVGVVPVLLAALLYALVVWNYEESDVQGAAAPLLASSWRTGQPAGSDQIAGVLARDAEGCPVLVSADGELAVVWPAGFSARVSPGGTLTVYDPADDAVVRVDQELRATGTMIEAAGSPYVGRPCAPASGPVAEIQSKVDVLR